MSTNTREQRPRAFYPDGTTAAPVRRRTPGWDSGPERRIDDGRPLARGLALFSFGLGLFQLVAPGRLTAFLGLDEDFDPVVRMYGAREIAHGVAIMSSRTPTAGVWSRVAGDALDLATLGATMVRAEPRRDRVLMAMAMVAGVGVMDSICAAQLSSGSNGSTRSR